MENENLSQSFIQKYDSLSDSFVVVEKFEKTMENNSPQDKRRKFEPFSFFKFKNRNSNAMQSDENVNNPQLPINPLPPQQNFQPQNPVEQNPPPRPPMPNPPPPRPQPVPPANTPVILSRDAYNKLKILNSLYRSLAISNPENAHAYNALANETVILQTSMLSIYQLLSGNNFIPAQNQTAPSFTGNVCVDILMTENYVQEIVDTCLALQRSVNIPNVDRQLAIIIATLLSQKSKLATLRSTCTMVNNGQ